MKKMLLGVTHVPELYDIVRNTILAYGPSSLGLEIPHDFEGRCRVGSLDNFFSQLWFDIGMNEYIRAGKVTKVPNGLSLVSLDDPALYDDALVLLYASGLLIDQRKAKKEIDHFLRGKDKERASGLIDRAYNIAAEYDSHVDIYYDLYLDNMAARENEMLCNILKHSPDVVVVGNNHAKNLAPFLPGYKFKKISVYSPENLHLIFP